jgi:hypothetical protein
VAAEPTSPATHARRWLDAWQGAAARLEAEQVAHLLQLDDESAWTEAASLFAMWEPGWVGDAGEGLLLQQAVFARHRHRAAP